jgi:hypothetical protein
MHICICHNSNNHMLHLYKCCVTLLITYIHALATIVVCYASVNLQCTSQICRVSVTPVPAFGYEICNAALMGEALECNPTVYLCLR